MKSYYKLKLYPDTILREKSLTVNDVNGLVHNLIKGMRDIMYLYKGIGLAAPQVGILQRVIIADLGEELISIVNPVIRQMTGNDFANEGCLSLPDIEVPIIRNHTIYVTGINFKGKELRREFSGLMARIIQHEIDHLDGVIILDYASSV
jgi:peptide deformylase